MNSLFVIAPYKWEGMWVFDDPRVGLRREPFVSGADVMMDKLVANLPGHRCLLKDVERKARSGDWRGWAVHSARRFCEGSARVRRG